MRATGRPVSRRSPRSAETGRVQSTANLFLASNLHDLLNHGLGNPVLQQPLSDPTLNGSALLQKLVRIPSLSAKLLLCVEKKYTFFQLCTDNATFSFCLFVCFWGFVYIYIFFLGRFHSVQVLYHEVSLVCDKHLD